MVAEAHLLVGEELVMVERVALVDGAQSFDRDRPVHDVLVHGPLEHVGEQERQRDRQPARASVGVLDVLEVDVEGRRAHRVDDGDVQMAVVEAHDARAVFLPECLLAFGDHVVSVGWSPRWYQAELSSRCAVIASSATTSSGFQLRERTQSGRGFSTSRGRLATVL